MQAQYLIHADVSTWRCSFISHSFWRCISFGLPISCFACFCFSRKRLTRAAFMLFLLLIFCLVFSRMLFYGLSEFLSSVLFLAASFISAAAHFSCGHVKFVFSSISFIHVSVCIICLILSFFQNWKGSLSMPLFKLRLLSLYTDLQELNSHNNSCYKFKRVWVKIVLIWYK